MVLPPTHSLCGCKSWPLLNAEAAPARVVLPVLLGGDTLPKPHGGNPLVALAQGTARVLSVPVVHPHARLGAVEEVAEEEHLPKAGNHFEPTLGEERIAALLCREAVGKARCDPRSQRVAAAAALAVAVRPVLVAIVLVVDRIDRLLPVTLDHTLVPRHLACEGELAPRPPRHRVRRVIEVGSHVDRVRVAVGGGAAASNDRGAHARHGEADHLVALVVVDEAVHEVDGRTFAEHVNLELLRLVRNSATLA
mmetsp:Transcript_39718/g.84618  ORF Transcript_39718/g.84618 Transcript_39718/m.84618 type:complete len:251 (+) Transcript_39718:251-1003(+)